MVDKEIEARFNFKLSESLERARAAPLLQGLSFYLTDTIKPPKDEMTLIIETAGRSCVCTLPYAHTARRIGS